MGISPSGGDGDGFALRDNLLCPRRQSRQSATGKRRLEKHFVFLCRLPRTPVFSTGEPPRGEVVSIRRGQRPGYRTSRRPLRSRWRLCRLTDAAYPLRVLPLRVGWIGTCSYKSCRAWLPSIAQRFGGRSASGAGAGCARTVASTHLLQVCTRQWFRRLQAYFGAGPSRLPSPGGTSNRGPRPPDWSFQGDGVSRGRGKSKSPFP